ncbi:MAG: hypothetical protein AAF942_09630 [Pseudomonadota bacterium]
MQLSLTPILLATQIGFLLVLARRAAGHGPAGISMLPTYALAGWIAVYGIATSILGARGVYVSDDTLHLLPGLWLQLVTVAACVLPVLAWNALRENLRWIVDRTPLHWFAYFHGLRVLAVGTAQKTMVGEFPVYFEAMVGIPDLLFGLSAFWIASRLKRGAVTARQFMIWNIVGALIIVPSAPILLQLGLPGPLYLFTEQPDARAVYTYPMSIAPMIVVPLFVMANLLVAWRLRERRTVPTRI